MELYFYTPEQNTRNCGKLVASAIQSIGGKGTTGDLLEEISQVVGQSEGIIESEIKRVLRQAIRNGFLVKEGKTYLFPKHKYEVDALTKRGRSSETRKRVDRDRLAIASKSQNKRRKNLSMNKSITRSPQKQSRSKSRVASK